ncbi:MAG: helix-turn-helix transcriptional regulator [Gammaproteobacteria bacterium]|nr:helix-turn-helix transcriptional regulator [Gammaproteobacteria bacterium]MYC52737.1 helix-turn-helix transcriptional regulator [Gammaproteobacteria bacterium]
MPVGRRTSSSPPAAVEDALKRLGRNIRIARLRRQLRIQDLAERMSVSRFTVADLERGKPGTSASAYFGALWSLGLLDHAHELAHPDRDEEGRVLESARAPRRAARPRRLDNDF